MSMRSALRALSRQPLVHFLTLGAMIFAATAVRHPTPSRDERRITIGTAEVERLRVLYAQQWGAAPAESEMPRLVDDYVRGEVLFREGSALGLGVDDAVVRNRIIQKMEFILEDESGAATPSDSEIASYYQEHQERYRTSARVAFTHVFFSPGLRGKQAKADALAALARLRSGPGSALRGDPCMLPSTGSLQDEADVKDAFGSEFARALFVLPTGSWEGPIASALGWHVVRVIERAPAQLPRLSEVRDQVQADLLAARRARVAEAAYAKVRNRYQVRVDSDALGAGNSIAEARTR